MKDLFGTIISGLCVLHCLVAPFLLLLGSSGAVAYLAHSFELHLFFYLSVIVIAAFSLPGSYQQHRKLMPIFMGMVGVIFLSLALMAESMFHWHEGETIMTVIGGIAMIAAHLYNKRLLAFIQPSSPGQA